MLEAHAFRQTLMLVLTGRVSNLSRLSTRPPYAVNTLKNARWMGPAAGSDIARTIKQKQSQYKRLASTPAGRTGSENGQELGAIVTID